MSPREVIIGIDIGSWTFKLCAYDGKQFEILTNEANFRQTPSLIAFTGNQRLVGEEAQNKMKSNYLNTIRAPMRLIGIERSFDLIEQELKNATARYEIAEELHFEINSDKDRKSMLQPEHLLIALMSKAKRIVENHNMSIEQAYIAIPSYLSHYERKIIKRCAEIAQLCKEPMLVDDWICLATDYSYSKIKQLKASEPRSVVFVDVGYSKLSLFTVQFNQNDAKLLDCEHLRFTGSKHMDHLMAEFYDSIFKGIRNDQTSIFTISKSLIKLLDSIEKQRTVLSANSDHHFNIESLIDDHDLIYNMRRDQFEKIVLPAINDIKRGLNNLKSRMPQQFKVHSVELIGGASRMPFLKNLVSSVFNIQPSRTLNQSESTVEGATAYGSIYRKFLPFDYTITNTNLTDICVSWNTSQNTVFYGQDDSQYSKKRIIFQGNCPVPDQYVMAFGYQGPIEMYIYYGQNVSTKSIGYMRFKTPNRVRFSLDFNKIVSVKLESFQFDILKLYDKKESKWEQMRKWQNDMHAYETRIKKIFELKNDYQAKLYQLKSKTQEFKDYMTADQYGAISEQMENIELWIEKEHNRSLGSEDDQVMYQQRMKQIIKYLNSFEMLQERKKNSEYLYNKSNILRVEIENLLKTQMTPYQSRKLFLLQEWLLTSIQKMSETQWDGYYLTENSLEFAFEEIRRIFKAV